MNKIDARGLLCPKPLILAKKELSSIKVGERFEILLDNDTACSNIEKFLKDNNASFEKTSNGESIILLITKGGESSHHAKEAEAYCAPVYRKHHVIAITSDSMGSGDENLGRLLMQGFINTIKEASPLPKTIILYNAGAKLAADDSPVIPSLKELSAMGVEIIVCGTCAQFFNIKERIAVGTISNMYTILQTLTDAPHIIRP